MKTALHVEGLDYDWPPNTTGHPALAAQITPVKKPPTGPETQATRGDTPVQRNLQVSTTNKHKKNTHGTSESQFGFQKAEPVFVPLIVVSEALLCRTGTAYWQRFSFFSTLEAARREGVDTFVDDLAARRSALES